MTSGKSDIIDVELSPRIRKEKAQAFFQGEYDEKDREKWVWLPLSQIEIELNTGQDYCVVSMPEWLAKEKELI